MLKYLIENSDLKAILKFGPQNFFKAVDLIKTLEVVNRIRKNSSHEALWREVCLESQALLKDSGDRIRLDHSHQRQVQSSLSISSVQGEWILHWFFYQIFYSRHWILDFRRKSWGLDSESWLDWAPKALYFEPSVEFKKGVQNLYLGFYLNQPELFQSGLKALGVDPACEILFQHFGDEDQSAVEFRLTHLESTFAQVFAACARKGVHVHAEFSALGVMLLSLYETLESAHLRLNVRKVFEDVV